MSNRISISDEDIDKLVKETLGFGQQVDRGLTGREYRSNIFERTEVVKERAEFALWDIAEAADVLTDDELRDAALEGIREYLKENAAEFQTKINTQAQIAKLELLDTPLYWVCWNDHDAEAFSNGAAAEVEAKRHRDGYTIQGDIFVRHSEAMMVIASNKDAAVAAYKALQRGER